MAEAQFKLLYSLIKQYEPKRRKFGRPRRQRNPERNTLDFEVWSQMARLAQDRVCALSNLSSSFSGVGECRCFSKRTYAHC